MTGEDYQELITNQQKILQMLRRLDDDLRTAKTRATGIQSKVR